MGGHGGVGAQVVHGEGHVEPASVDDHLSAFEERGLPGLVEIGEADEVIGHGDEPLQIEQRLLHGLGLLEDLRNGQVLGLQNRGLLQDARHGGVALQGLLGHGGADGALLGSQVVLVGSEDRLRLRPQRGSELLGVGAQDGQEDLLAQREPPSALEGIEVSGLVQRDAGDAAGLDDGQRLQVALQAGPGGGIQCAGLAVVFQHHAIEAGIEVLQIAEAEEFVDARGVFLEERQECGGVGAEGQ